ncbi:MAG: sodium:proton antiporter [Candidatus Thermoplasmatota archaeon]|nr:sodium:proton antiporter [Candidatus Thermoplasmatota archaeon]
MSSMSKIVRTMTNILFPLTMIFGLYVIAHGHLTPGGGFQGGAIVASACALLVVTYGSRWVLGRIKEKRLSTFESIGAVSFITLAFLGLVFSMVFFGNFLAGSNLLFGTTPVTGSTLADFNTGGVLPLMNFAVGIKVVTGLFAIVLIMAYASSTKEWNS